MEQSNSELKKQKKSNVKEIVNQINSKSILNLKQIIQEVNQSQNPALKETFIKKYSKIVNQNEAGEMTINYSQILSKIQQTSQLEFTDDQQNSLSFLVNFLVNPNQNLVGLYGYAGTGKTTTLVEFINYLISHNHAKKIALTAPTNKAVNVIKSKMRSHIQKLYESICQVKLDSNYLIHDVLDALDKHKINIEFITTHRLLNYKNDVNSNGDKEFVKSGASNLHKYDLVIIDECSMLPLHMIYHIMEDINYNQKENKPIPKIIFSGDPCQLPSVNERISVVFLKSSQDLSEGFYNHTVTNLKKNDKFSKKRKTISYNQFTSDIINIESYTLKDVVRNKINNVVNLCYNVREWVLNLIQLPQLGPYGGNGVYLYKYDPKIKKTETNWFRKFMTLQQNTDNPTNNIILTWTNKMTEEYNFAIRQKMFNKLNIGKYEIGDILMLNDFYNINEGKSKLFKHRFYTSEQIKVTDIDIGYQELGKFVTVIPQVVINSVQKQPISNMLEKFIDAVNKYIPFKFKIWKLSVQRMTDILIKDTIPESYTIHVIHEDEQEQYEKSKNNVGELIKSFRENLIKQFSQECYEIDDTISKILWKQWNSIYIDQFANVSYGNSYSVHKSQGSSFYNVFIDSEDILSNYNDDESKRCLYTALTRSSNEIHLLV